MGRDSYPISQLHSITNQLFVNMGNYFTGTIQPHVTNKDYTQHKPRNPPKDPCQHYACEIQACIERHKYDQEKCQRERQAYEECLKQEQQKFKYK